MKTKQSDFLFQLIKSLSKAEKRYFKLYSTLHKGEKNYLKLFNVLDKQKKYDKIALNKQFAGEPFIINFSVAKAYLYDLILKSLQSYQNRRELSAKTQLNDLFTQIELLYNKGLYDHCKKLLSKAKRISIEYNLQLKTIEVCDWERAILYAQADFKRLPGYLNDENNLRKLSIEQYKNLFAYYEITDSMNIVLNKSQVIRTKEDAITINKLFKNNLLKDEKEALTPRAKFQFYFLYAMLYGARQDNKSLYEIAKKLTSTVDADEENKVFTANEKIGAYHIAFSSCVYLMKFPEYFKYAEKAKKVVTTSIDSEIRLFSLIASHDISAHYTTGNLEGCVTSMNYTEAGLKKYENKIGYADLMVLYINLIHAAIVTKNYEKALLWINIILNDSRIEYRHELQCYARILNLLIHFELKNYLLLEHTVKATYHFLKKQNNLFKFEQLVLDFIKDCFKIKNEKELIILFKKLKTGFEKIISDPVEKVLFDYFDYISWLDSKITNKPLYEILKQKYLKKTTNV